MLDVCLFCRSLLSSARAVFCCRLRSTVYCLLTVLFCLLLAVVIIQHAQMLLLEEEMAKDFTVADTLCVAGSGIRWTKPVTAFLRARARAREEKEGGL